MKRWRCTICNHIYDPAIGDPDTGVPPGTPFEKLPESWCCPDLRGDQGRLRGDVELDANRPPSSSASSSHCI